VTDIVDPLATTKEKESIYQMTGVVKLFKHRKPHPDADKPVFIEIPGIFVPSVPYLLSNVEAFVSQVDERDRWNLHYSLCHCDENAPGRVMTEQEVIPFDIDGANIERIDDYLSFFIKETGLDAMKIAYGISGAGIHIVVRVAPFKEDYITKTKMGYHELCTKIEGNFGNYGLSGSFDRLVYSKNHTLRLPQTINRKEGRPDLMCYLLRNTLAVQSLDLTKWDTGERAPGEEKKKAKKPKHMPQPAIDKEAILAETGCAFLRRCFQNQNDTNEADWYAALGVMAFSKGGRESCHLMSEQHGGYTFEATEAKINQILEKQTGPRTCANIALQCAECATCPHYTKVTTPLQIHGDGWIASEENGFWIDVFNAKGQVVKQTPDYAGLLMAYNREAPYKTIPQGIVFKWTGKHWKEVEDVTIKAWCTGVMKPEPLSHVFDEFHKQVKVRNITDLEFFSPINYPGLVNMDNGIYNIETNEVIPHSQSYGFPSVLPYAYNPTAECPRFYRYLQETLNNDKEIIDLVCEYIGYILSAANPAIMPHFMVLSGSGANGKSVLLDTIAALVGKDNCTHLSMSDMADAAMRPMLIGKLANLSTENSDEKNLNSENMKLLTSGEAITAHIMYKNRIVFKPVAKHIFACNSIPRTNDTSNGLYRRMLIVPFDRTFAPHEQDRGLTKYLIENELPGIFNLCITKWKIALSKKQFTIPARVVEENADYQISSNSVAFWYQEKITLVPVIDPPSLASMPKHWYTNEEILALYKSFCQENNMTPFYGQKFWGFIRQVMGTAEFKARCARKLIAGNRCRVVMGLKIDGVPEKSTYGGIN